MLKPGQNVIIPTSCITKEKHFLILFDNIIDNMRELSYSCFPRYKLPALGNICIEIQSKGGIFIHQNIIVYHFTLLPPEKTLLCLTRSVSCLADVSLHYKSLLVFRDRKVVFISFAASWLSSEDKTLK